MSVLVSPITIAGRGPGTDLSVFSDTFNRASNSDLGVNWLDTVFRTGVVDPVNSATWSIGAQFDATQGLNIDTVGNNNPNTFWTTGIFAIPTRRRTRTVNQFVQATFEAQTGPAVGQPSMAIALLVNDQLGDMYGLRVNGSTSPFRLLQWRRCHCSGG